ncbi:MAG: EamA family transporter [Lentisphaerae bacterium]|nr:EamA family transporter [Lentisphaerota bacterium]
MFYLSLASLLWAFSFGLIKQHMTGLDPYFVVWARLVLSLVPFALFFRPRSLSASALLKLTGVGAVQYGFMYVAYLLSYRHLQAHQVALFTVLTPLYVWWMAALRTRRFGGRGFLAVLLAIVGAGAIVFSGSGWRGAALGFLLVQASNLAFAFGQLAYRGIIGPARKEADDMRFFAALYFGGVVFATVAVGMFGDWTRMRPTPLQGAVLAYLGLIPSGLGFLLWNMGARRVTPATLAVFNNVKVPLAVAAAVTVFGERADWRTLLPGAGLICLALALSSPKTNRRQTRRASAGSSALG